MSNLPDFVVSGEVARLIPVIADTRREQRVASVFLATLAAIPEFARPLLSTVGFNLGKRSVTNTYTEVVLDPDKKAAKDRPDGLIVVTTGKKTWKALVEVKIGNALLDEEQVHRYLQLAKDKSIDAVITISNQFAVRADHAPVAASKVLLRRVGLYHWSWKSILTEAFLLQTNQAVADPDQAFILREFLRFLSHDSIGVTGFDTMPPAWREAIVSVKSGGTIRKAAPETQTVVGAWHQETRDLALRMSQHLGISINVKLPRAHAKSADERMKADCAELAEQNRLMVDYAIPNAASVLSVVVDLKAQTIHAGMEVEAPQDRQTSMARVNWLLRQLKAVTDENVFVKVLWPSRAQGTVCRLSDLRENAKEILAETSLAPRGFIVFHLSDDGRRFAGRKTFIEELETIVPRFYDQIGQHLEAWVPKPPKPLAQKEPAQKEMANAEVGAAVQPVDPEASRGPPSKGTSSDSHPAHSQSPESQKAARSDLTPGNDHAAILDLPPFLRRFRSGE